MSGTTGGGTARTQITWFGRTIGLQSGSPPGFYGLRTFLQGKSVEDRLVRRGVQIPPPADVLKEVMAEVKMRCPLPWVAADQRYMIVLSPDGEVAHLAKVDEWQYEGLGTALCGAEVLWALSLDEQTDDERPCAKCIVAAAA